LLLLFLMYWLKNLQQALVTVTVAVVTCKL
jgi:hypothetical protein